MGKPVKTETTVRQYDVEDTLVAETTTVVTQTNIEQQESQAPGFYL
jgi:hypothetical protein